MTQPLWMQLHADDLRRVRTTARRMLPALLALYIVILFAFTIKLMGMPYAHLSAVSNLSSLQNTEVVQLVRMVFGFGIAEWLVTVLSLGLLLIWMALAFPAWILMRLLLEFIWPWFYPTDPVFFRAYCRMTRFLHHAFRRQNLVAVTLALFLAAVFLVKSRVWTLTPARGAIVIGAVLLAAVPYVYTVHWTWFSRLLRRHPRAKNLDLHFFSQHTARRKLKNAIDILIFLALLTWFWLPTYFSLCKGLSDVVAPVAREILDYQGKWTALSQRVIFSSPVNEQWFLPAPARFEERLDFAGMVRDVFPITKAMPTFQKYLFAFVMFSTLLELAIPAIYNAGRIRGYRLAFRQLLVATLKTTILLAVLQVFVLRTYFIDMSALVGLGAMFAFIVAVAIAQDEQFYKKWKTRPTKRPTTTPVPLRSTGECER